MRVKRWNNGAECRPSAGPAAEAAEKRCDARLAAAEKTAQFNTNALDHALEKIETSANQRATDQVEIQRRAAQTKKHPPAGRRHRPAGNAPARTPNSSAGWTVSSIRSPAWPTGWRHARSQPIEIRQPRMQALSPPAGSAGEGSQRPGRPRCAAAAAPGRAAGLSNPRTEAPPIRAYEPPPPARFEAAALVEPPPADESPPSRRRRRSMPSPPRTGFHFDIPAGDRSRSLRARLRRVLADFGPVAASAAGRAGKFPGPGAPLGPRRVGKSRNRTPRPLRRLPLRRTAARRRKASPRYLIPVVVALIVVLAAAAAPGAEPARQEPAPDLPPPAAARPVPALHRRRHRPTATDTQFVVAPQATPRRHGANTDDSVRAFRTHRRRAKPHRRAPPRRCSSAPCAMRRSSPCPRRMPTPRPPPRRRPRDPAGQCRQSRSR